MRVGDSARTFVPLSGTDAPIGRPHPCRPPKVDGYCNHAIHSRRSAGVGTGPDHRDSRDRPRVPRLRRRSRSSRLPPSIPKSTVSRLVGDLVRQRYLTRTDGGVAIGLRLFELGARASTPRRLGVAALPVLAELFNATGEHLNVAVQEGHDMLSVISVRGRLRPAPSRAGVRVPSVTTALGKAVLAFTEDESTLRDIMTGLDPRARHMLERELAGVRTCCGGGRPMRDVPRSDRRGEPDPVPRALPGRRHLRGRAGGRHGPEPDGAARASCRAGAHAPTGTAGGLSRERPNRRGQRPRPHDRDPRSLRRETTTGFASRSSRRVPTCRSPRSRASCPRWCGSTTSSATDRSSISDFGCSNSASSPMSRAS